jgi:hypothetical protein
MILHRIDDVSRVIVGQSPIPNKNEIRLPSTVHGLLIIIFLLFSFWPICNCSFFNKKNKYWRRMATTVIVKLTERNSNRVVCGSTQVLREAH